jgi:hypothetical protein
MMRMTTASVGNLSKGIFIEETVMEAVEMCPTGVKSLTGGEP